MKTIEHYLEPEKLLVSWQQPQGSGEGLSRTRQVIGEIIKSASVPSFKYLTDTEDFSRAREQGFTGLQAFKISSEPYSNNVMEVFMRRLPPRSRADFKDYLYNFGLPEDFDGSDFALLAHTGAKLPSDGFEVLPDLSQQKVPFDFVIEVAGTRYVNPAMEKVSISDEVSFREDPDNAFDCHAINVYSNNMHIGFVPRPFSAVFARHLAENKVQVSIQKINGRPSRPIIYLFVSISQGRDQQ